MKSLWTEARKKAGDDIGWTGWEGVGNKLLDKNKKEKKKAKKRQRGNLFKNFTL